MPDEKVFAKFEQRRWWRDVISLIALIGCVLGFAVGISPLWGLLIVIVAAGLVAWIWRCPVCGRLLGRDGSYAYCPHCGSRLRA